MEKENILLGKEVLRAQIDTIDEKVLELLAQRLQIAEQLGRIKKQEGMDVYDPSREAQVLAHWQERCREIGIPPEQIQPVVEAIIFLSRTRQQ